MATSATDVNNSAPIVQQMDNSMQQYIDAMVSQANANSAWNAQQAAEQRDWTERQTRLTMDYNAAEAAKNRDWQEYMSNTAHQREVADLKAAGLNPVLSASGGNGAAVSSGATASAHSGNGAEASADTSANSAIVGLLSAMLNRQTQLYMADLNARTQEALSERANSTNLLLGQLSAGATKFASEMSSSAMRYSASQSAYAQMYGAELAQAANMYSADQHLLGQQYAVDFANPNNLYSLVYSLGKQFGLVGEDGNINELPDWLFSLFGLERPHRGQKKFGEGNRTRSGFGSSSNVQNRRGISSYNDKR